MAKSRAVAPRVACDEMPRWPRPRRHYVPPMHRVVGTAVIVIAALGCVQQPADDTHRDVRKVQSIVRHTASPFCPGKALDSCPSPQAATWRRDIHAWVSEGVAEPEIRQRLQARVPGFDLTIPPAKWGWTIPTTAVVLSSAWFVVMARRLRRRSTVTYPTPADADGAAFDARLDEELARLD